MKTAGEALAEDDGDEDDDEDDDEEDEEGIDEDAEVEMEAQDLSAATAPKKRPKGPSKEESKMYCAHRGLDLVGVSTVLNLDMPASVKAYVHRAGRTARGGSNGTALSFVTDSDEEILSALLGSDKMELSPLGLKLSEIECFRYRVDDVLQGVNKKTIMKARARELQHELITNARLKSKLEQTDDLRALKRSSRQIKQSVAGRDSLRHLPAYLIPDQTLNGSNAVQAAVAAQAEERSRKRKADPLKTFTPKQKRRKAGDLSNSLRREPDHKTATVDKLPPLSGRKLWKIRHGKKVGKLMQRQGAHGNARSTSKRAKESRKQGIAV